jgi:asparagine synthase (glutamine-hydrolysing)
MCGIAGLVGGDRALLERMSEQLAHRGPDAAGLVEHTDLDVRLAHTRFAIIDLDRRSDQPFVSPCGRYALTFNGEIYNYVELRARLTAVGVEFLTTSDTEVLLQWLIHHGTSGIGDLEGMFAFAFLDRGRRALLLARDPIGEKPLFYALPTGSDAPRFAFASELRALLAVPGVDLCLDEDALADWLRFLYTAAPRTLYRGIRELAPGHRLEIALDSVSDRPTRTYDLESRIPMFDGDARAAADAFRTAFRDSVRLRLRSDVPIGLFLSGGLDSNAILAAARSVEPSARIETYTARWSGSPEARARDESIDAANSARVHGVPHHALEFGEDQDLEAAVERALHLFGTPFGNSTALVSDRLAGEASRLGRVCLVGDGGDELLAGYPRHRALLAQGRLSALPRALHGLPSAIAELFPERGANATGVRRARSFLRSIGRPLGEAFLDWTGYVDDAGLARALGARARSGQHATMLELFTRNAADPLRAAALVDLCSFVPFNLMTSADRTGMAHPLELRSPFLAPPLVELALSLPAAFKVRRGRVKPVLVDALGAQLAPGVATRRKKPFNPPVRPWLARHERELGRMLVGATSELGHVVSPSWLRTELAAFRAGQRDNSTLLFGLATLSAWLSRPTQTRPTASRTTTLGARLTSPGFATNLGEVSQAPIARIRARALRRQ